MSIDFSTRSYEAEWMDDFDVGGEMIEQTLREIATINKWLGGNSITLKAVKDLLNVEKEEIKIVDVGCGGGEMLRLISNWAKRKGKQVQLIGIDANPHVIAYAEKCSRGYSDIEYLTMDIFSEGFKKIKCDIIMATLFLHHFTDEQLINLFKIFSRQSSRGVIINDLHRHRFAYHSINLITRLFSKSKMVQNDARLSVLRSFSKPELSTLLKTSGISEFSIKWRWAFRWEILIPTSN